MALPPRLSSLKASQIKYAAFLMGIPSTGTKTELVSAIRHQVGAQPRHQRAERVVSIDMGIRNLGICVLQSPEKTVETSSNALSIRIAEWKRMAVSLFPSSPLESRKAIQPRAKPIIDPAAFNPSNLSKTAVQVASDLLKYKPSHILIERQRFRSGGASAVQEWTLRVNALESMLWAALETIRSSDKTGNFPDVHEMSPARVARFWCAAPVGYETVASEALLADVPASSMSSGTLARQSAKRTVEKKEKIAMARSWLSPDTAMTAPGKIALELSDEAQVTADAFLPRHRKSNSRRSKSSNSSEESSNDKLDDLADCLLQGVAWLRWQENQERVRAMFKSDFEGS